MPIRLKQIPGKPVMMTDDLFAQMVNETVVYIPYTVDRPINQALQDLLIQWRTVGLEVIRYRNTGGFIDIIRARMAHEFLTTPKNFLVMIDSDIIPPVETPIQLASHNLPVVGCVCPITHPINGLSPNMGFVEGKVPLPLPLDGVYEVDWIGTGVICISSEVLKEVGPEAFLIPDTERLEAVSTGKLNLAEDQAFCSRVRDTGHTIAVDLSLRPKHLMAKYESFASECSEGV